MHLITLGPHGILLILSFVFAVIAVIPSTRPIPWFALSWAFFVASFLFLS
jgi:hypothetical protein